MFQHPPGLPSPGSPKTGCALNTNNSNSLWNPGCLRLNSPWMQIICLAPISSRESYIDVPLDYGSHVCLLPAPASPRNPSLDVPAIKRDPPTLFCLGNLKPGCTLDSKCLAWCTYCLLHPGNLMPRHSLVNKASNGIVLRESIT